MIVVDHLEYRLEKAGTFAHCRFSLPSLRSDRLIAVVLGRYVIADGDSDGSMVERVAQPLWLQGFSSGGELPQRPIGMPPVLKDHLQAQPALGVRFFRDNGQCRSHEVLPSLASHSNHDGDLISACTEPRAPIPPGAVQIDAVRSLRGFGEFLSREDAGQPIRSLFAGSRGEEVPLITYADQADRVVFATRG